MKNSKTFHSHIYFKQNLLRDVVKTLCCRNQTVATVGWSQHETCAEHAKFIKVFHRYHLTT